MRACELGRRRGREKERGNPNPKQALCSALSWTWGSIPRPLDLDLSWNQEYTLNRWNHPDAPKRPFIKLPFADSQIGRPHLFSAYVLTDEVSVNSSSLFQPQVKHCCVTCLFEKSKMFISYWYYLTTVTKIVEEYYPVQFKRHNSSLTVFFRLTQGSILWPTYISCMEPSFIHDIKFITSCMCAKSVWKAHPGNVSCGKTSFFT